MEDNSIWLKYIIPIIIGPVFVTVKTIWDRYSLTRYEQKMYRKKERKENIESKLKMFYWPIYIRLLRDYEIRSNIIENKELKEIQIDEEEIEELRRSKCKYKENNEECKNYVPENIKTTYGCYCISHKYTGLLNAVKQANTPIVSNNKKQVEERTEEAYKILTEREIKLPEQTILNIREESIVEKMCRKETKGRLEDLKKTYKELQINKKVVEHMNKIILENHKTIVTIIENNIAIAEPHTTMGKQLMKYLKYVSILTMLHESGETNIKPDDLGSSYPKNLLPLIESQLFNLQKEYNNSNSNF